MADEGPCNSCRRVHQSRRARWLGPTRAGAAQVGSSYARTSPHKPAGCTRCSGGSAADVTTESTLALTLTLPECENSKYPPELLVRGGH